MGASPGAGGTGRGRPLAGFDLTRHVPDVRVDDGVVVGGETMDRITSVINTSGALEGLLGTLGGTGASGFDQASDVFGDMRAERCSTCLSERTCR